MSKEEISKLIRKYYDGESTDEDEKYLRALFSSDQVPEGFETEKELILFCMAKGHFEGASPDLEERILKKIDEPVRKSYELKSGKYFLPVIGGIAAAIMLIIGTYFFLESRNITKDTFSDPKLAYAETMKILMDVSVRLNKGTKALEPVGKLSTMTEMSLQKISKSSSLINKSLSKLNKLSEVADEKKISNPRDKNK